MTLKSKITLSLVFLFSIILVLGGMSAYYLNRLSDDSKAILKDNYISLEFASNMQKALTTLTYKGKPDNDALTDFDENLTKEERNITEVGEQEATTALRREFNRLKNGKADSLTISRIRQNLLALDDLNRQAIMRKSDTAETTAKEALLWLAVVGTFCFLLVLSFVVNIPRYIANPVSELTRGIKQIASRNFEERLHVRSSDEFGELARSFNSMAQKLDEYEHSNLARVLFAKKRIDTLVQIMHDAIIGLDEKRIILFVNPVASRLLGVDAGQLVGKYAPDVASTNDLMRTLIQDIMLDNADRDSSGPVNGTHKVMSNTLLKIYDPAPEGPSSPGPSSPGKESYFTKQIQTVEVTPTGEQQPVQAGYVIVLQNVTSYKELDLAKTNFIATISHELKTPLSSSKMSLKLLEDSRIGQLNDEQKQLVSHIGTDVNRLLNLTSELLNMTQVESGQIQLNMQAVAPADIVRYATNALRVQAESKQISLDVVLTDTLPTVLADPDKTSWVLVNFLSNAIRHSPQETRIDVSATIINKSVEFRVRDHGPGIRPEHQNRVFERYFKASNLAGQTADLSAGSTGLGLAISSEFIQSMNGQIGLDAHVTDGAAFFFQLPISPKA